MGREFDNKEFWTSVIELFVNSRRLDPARIEPIVEYLQDQKFECRTVIIGEDTEVYFGPPQPELSVKGRTVGSLMRRVVEWQAERKAEAKRTLIRWDRSTIGEFHRRDEADRTWTIRELLDSDEMAAEGKAMEHCVATYAGCCARRLTTIWSVGIEMPEGRERVVTVEVNPASREIIQAKARCNEDPDESCVAIMKEWAGREGLKLEG